MDTIDVVARIKAIHAESQLAQDREFADSNERATGQLRYSLECARAVAHHGQTAAAPCLATHLCLARSLTTDALVKDGIESLLGDCLLAAMTAHKEG
jgi:hypothetical protein